MKKGHLVVFLVIFMLFVMSGCNKSEGKQEEQKKAKEDKIQIGMSFDSFVIERWQRDRDIFVSIVKEQGAEVNVQNANGDVEEQRRQIEYFIQKGMDVIVIICVDSDSLSEQVKKAKEAGIKVIAYDRLLNNSDVDLYISFDNEMVGTMMAQTLVDHGVAGGNVLMLGGSLTDNNVPLVENAFKKVAEENNITILDSMHADGWRAELAGNYIYDQIDMVNKADAIMCGNDNLASQVIRALSEKRLAGRIFIVGQDADLEACQKIVEGTQLMTVYKPVENLAKRAAECALCLARGEDIGQEGVDVINDGKYEVPYVKLAPISVTKENMVDVIINSGFHLKEDVYLNVPYMMNDK